MSTPANLFYAFYKSMYDPEIEAQTYAQEATVHAGRIQKEVAATAVDVSNNAAELKYWGGSTIECVTVKAGAIVRSLLNPTLPEIDEMIEQL